VKAEPQVPHLQLVNALAGRLGPSLLVWGWFGRTAKTNSPPHSEHSRFCIAPMRLVRNGSPTWGVLYSSPYYGTDRGKQAVNIDLLTSLCGGRGDYDLHPDLGMW